MLLRARLSGTCPACPGSKPCNVAGLRQYRANVAHAGSARRQQQPELHRNGAPRHSKRQLVLAAAAAKGFGKVKPVLSEPNSGCPCGSGKFYKECCKPVHKGTADSAADLEATIRARFSAVVKREVTYLMSTFHPDFHSFQYGTAPGGASEKLEDDMKRTCSDYVYTNLRILKIEPSAEQPHEASAEFQYTVENKKTPELDGNGNKRRLVRMEKSRFAQGEDAVWRFVDYQMADVPEALVKLKEREVADQAKAQGQPA